MNCNYKDSVKLLKICKYYFKIGHFEAAWFKQNRDNLDKESKIENELKLDVKLISTE